MPLPDNIAQPLLTQTLRQFVAAEAAIADVQSVQLRGGLSGAAIWRHTIQYETSQGPAKTSLITKETDHQEWRVLQRLIDQQQPNIPFACAAHTLDENRVVICMQDVGDQNRPTSLDPISEEELVREAEGLAAIHAANVQQKAQLDWLPEMTAGYIQEMLFERTWLPAWTAALHHPGFTAAFGNAIPRVEAAAASIVADMRMLLDDPTLQTMIHTDINPSNVLVQDGKPYFIDWQSAMRGPFYIDLPHHYCTLAQAEHYRRAFAAHGYAIPREDFAECYRIAARYTGLRYIWWSLESWMEDQTQTAWVQHYLGLITGDGIG